MNEDINDILVPWNLQQNYNSGEHQIYNRYYHLFDENELENLIHKFKNVCIKERGYQKDNWYVIIKKI
jgi:hypothetical protein